MAGGESSKINFEKAVYFSIVSFHTIGFGDIHPITQLGRQIVMIQSTISLFFTSIFSGFLVYFVIKRPQDVFTTKKEPGPLKTIPGSGLIASRKSYRIWRKSCIMI
ncbi:MAG: potassium channel family protein [Bacteroidetes bacterium]|nr:potassium channel family protein [Bacteroidota bacterium]